MSLKKSAIDRRQFIASSVAASGLLLSGRGLSQTQPCPPLLDGGGAGGGGPGCLVGAEEDWQSRIAGSGVVWFHDFRSPAEVDAFRWCAGYSSGNDPLDVGTSRTRNSVRHVTTDGITGGGCLELVRSAGKREGKDWWRPWSPMASPGNGKNSDDPAAGGTIDVETWSPTDGGNQTSRYSGGDYGPASTGQWDGDTFYLQMAMKLDSRRRNAGVHGGKISYLTRTNVSLTAQELVTYYKGSERFSIYRGGSPEVSSNLTNVDHVWDQWATYLYKVVPGDEYQNNTSIEVWRALSGETVYTKIFETFDQYIDYSDAFDKAWNALICSSYHNGIDMPTDFYQRYDQIIFSKEYIPCPQV